MFSQAVRDRIVSPTKVGPLERATHTGEFGRQGDGPYITLWLQVVEDRVVAAAWSSNGCPGMMAVSSALAEVVEGKSLSELSAISHDDITARIGPLPEGRERAMDAGLAALKDALQTGVSQ